MKHQTFLKMVLCCSLVVLAMLSAQVQGQPPQGRRGGAFGDWLVKVDYDGRQFESILSFSRDQEGNRTAQWISFMGLTDLKDVSYEDGKLSFAMERRNREGQTSTTKFTGTIQDGKLTGTMSSDRGERSVEGTRMPRISRAVGSWEMSYKIGDRDITSTLVIKADKENNLTGEWKSRMGAGTQTVSDLKYERGTLTFKRTGKYQDRQFESTFEGSIDRQTGMLTGTFKSDRGEIAAEGKRIGAPLIGDWKLEIASDRGTRTQRLRVNPDMTGLYGALPIKKITFKDGKVDFPLVMQFGDQSFEMSFAGKLADSKLTGELTSSRGSQKITGTKIVRTFRRRTQ
jgi:hypothetical protein